MKRAAVYQERHLPAHVCQFEPRSLSRRELIVQVRTHPVGAGLPAIRAQPVLQLQGAVAILSECYRNTKKVLKP
jgi:hypothetical protein